MSVQERVSREIRGTFEKAPLQGPCGVCLTDERGAIMYVSSAGERHLGVASTAAIGRTLCQLLCEHPLFNGEARCPLGDCAPSARISEAPIEAVSTRNNLRIRYLTMPTFMAQDDRAGYLVLIDDVSMEKELERSRDDWRDMIAHDLGTPLMSLFTGLRALDETLSKKSLEPGERKLLEMSLRASRRMMHLLDMFLNVVRLESGLQVAGRNISFFSLLQECLEEHFPLIRSRRLEIEVSVLPSLVVHADPELLHRVIQNILNNAVKFSPEGGRISIREIDGSDGMAAISFKDSGPGISAKDAPLLFNRFYRAKIWREKRVPGNGLGLAFCHEAMRAMGGDICAVASPGEGGEFVIRLPMAMSEPAADGVAMRFHGRT